MEGKEKMLLDTVTEALPDHSTDVQTDIQTERTGVAPEEKEVEEERRGKKERKGVRNGDTVRGKQGSGLYFEQSEAVLNLPHVRPQVQSAVRITIFQKLLQLLPQSGETHTRTKLNTHTHTYTDTYTEIHA